MEHALTSTHAGSSCSSVEVDQEISQQIEARLQQKLRRCSWWIFFVPLVIVIVLTFVFGVPQMIHGWVDHWFVPAEVQRQREVQEFIRSFFNPGAMGVGNESVAPYLVLGIGIPLLVFLGWGVFAQRRSFLRRIRGINRSGLFACPRCGSDTRTDSASCSACRDVESARIPPYWRQIIGEEPMFDQVLTSGPRRIDLGDEFQESRSRALHNKRVAFILMGVSGLAFVCLIVFSLMPALKGSSFFISSTSMLAASSSFVFGTLLLKVSWNRFAAHGFCRECKYERAPDAPAGACQECGEEVTDGSLVFAYRKPAPLEWWLPFISIVPGVVFLSFIGLGVY